MAYRRAFFICAMAWLLCQVNADDEDDDYQCMSFLECDEDEYCINKRCVPRYHCRHGDDCPIGYKCTAFQCVAKNNFCTQISLCLAPTSDGSNCEYACTQNEYCDPKVGCVCEYGHKRSRSGLCSHTDPVVPVRPAPARYNTPTRRPKLPLTQMQRLPVKVVHHVPPIPPVPKLLSVPSVPTQLEQHAPLMNVNRVRKIKIQQAHVTAVDQLKQRCNDDSHCDPGMKCNNQRCEKVKFFSRQNPHKKVTVRKKKVRIMPSAQKRNFTKNKIWMKPTSSRSMTIKKKSRVPLKSQHQTTNRNPSNAPKNSKRTKIQLIPSSPRVRKTSKVWIVLPSSSPNMMGENIRIAPLSSFTNTVRRQCPACYRLDRSRKCRYSCNTDGYEVCDSKQKRCVCKSGYMKEGGVCITAYPIGRSNLLIKPIDTKLQKTIYKLDWRDNLRLAKILQYKKRKSFTGKKNRLLATQRPNTKHGTNGGKTVFKMDWKDNLRLALQKTKKSHPTGKVARNPDISTQKSKSNTGNKKYFKVHWRENMRFARKMQRQYDKSSSTSSKSRFVWRANKIGGGIVNKFRKQIWSSG